MLISSGFNYTVQLQQALLQKQQLLMINPLQV